MKKGKGKLFLCFLFILLVGILPGWKKFLNAGGLLQTVDRWTSLFPSDYGFSFRFIPGVTSVSYGGFSHDASLAWHDKYANKVDGIWSPGDQYNSILINLNACSKGVPWVRYSNVGTYKGQIVDVRFTIMDWNTYQSPQQSASGDVPTVVFNTKNIAIGQSNYNRYDTNYKVELMQHGTNTLMPSNIKYHFTFMDIDGGTIYATPNPDGSARSARESIIIPAYNFDNAYIVNSNPYLTSYYNGDHVIIKNQTDYKTTDDDINGHVTFMMSGPSFMYAYNTDLEGNSYSSRSFFNHMFTGDAVAGFDSPQILKSTSNDSIELDGGYAYYLDFTLPDESVDFRYPTIAVTDTLAACLTLNGGIDIMDDAGVNRTSEFNIGYDGESGVVNVSAKNSGDATLYGKSYRISIPVKVKDEYKDLQEENGTMLSYADSTGTTVANTASLQTRNTIGSNTVNTAILYKVSTSVVNGTITPSQENLTGNKDYTYEFYPDESHEIEKVWIDGVDRTSEFPNVNQRNQVTFSSIHANHTVDVTYKRVYKIDTSVLGGTITESMVSIDKGENKTITYQSQAGYYLRRLSVDGVEVNVKENPKSYTFHNINEDHTIHAEFLPQPSITIKKKIYLDEVYFPSGNPTFIFELKGVDYMGDSHTYYQSVNFTKADIAKAKEEGGRKVLEKVMRWNDINAGSYEVREILVSRYQQQSITDILSGDYKDDILVLHTDGSLTAQATFVNERQRYHNYSDNDFIRNEFHE